MQTRLKNTAPRAILIKQGGEEMARRAKTEADYAREQRYIKTTYRWINVQFSRKSADDDRLYEYVAAQPESKAAYIKRLIREDMEKNFSGK